MLMLVLEAVTAFETLHLFIEVTDIYSTVSCKSVTEGRLLLREASASAEGKMMLI